MKIDHHVHTSKHSPDSIIHPRQLISNARAAGLDGVVITEHDYQWGAGELAELSAEAEGLLVLSGAEISAREGHFLVYGLPDLSDAPAGIRVRDLVKLVRSHKGAIVAAHPFRWGQPFDEILDDLGPCFDALEVVSNNIDSSLRSQIELAANAHPKMGRSGSSDGHDPEVVGCYFSHFSGSIRSMADFVSALHARAGRPSHCESRFLISGPVLSD